jgi:hypothetical protein
MTLPICHFCNIQASDKYERLCENATEASSCWFHPSRRPKATPQVVGPDFERIEDSPARLSAMQELIRSGTAWHPDIDQDGHIGRQANDLIARKLCKPPRSEVATRARHMFDVAERFGLHAVRRERT